MLVAAWCWTASRRHEPSAAADFAAASKSTSLPPVPASARKTQPFLAELPEPPEPKPVRKIRSIAVDPLPDFDPPESRPAFASSVPVDKIDAAIEKGVRWFRENPRHWFVGGESSLGYVALPGLALLESGVDPADSQIQKAARSVREMAARGSLTYEISLAILFLDRLGDPADDPLIRRLAVRLIAEQTSRGGWDYPCRSLSRDLEMPLLAALDAMRPQIDLSKPMVREPGKGLIELPIGLVASQKDKGIKAGEPSSRSVGKIMKFELSPEAQRLVRELPTPLRHIPVFDPEATTKPRAISARAAAETTTRTRSSRCSRCGRPSGTASRSSVRSFSPTSVSRERNCATARGRITSSRAARPRR